MKAQYHREITIQALSHSFGPAALQTIIAANLGQDALRYQFGHDHFHFDNNSFAAGNAYIQKLRQTVWDALERNEARLAHENFGRLTHTVQDLYAHSNYISLWRQHNPAAAPQEIDPLIPWLLQNPLLQSGKLYYPLEALSFIPFLKPFVVPLLPRDSHAWMNIDEPACQNFEFAFAAALKRSVSEYFAIIEKLPPQQEALFAGINMT